MVSLDEDPIMRLLIFLLGSAVVISSIHAAEPTPAPKPAVRQSVKQLPQTSQSVHKTFSKRTDVKDSNDRHATVEDPAPPPPPPKRTATNSVTKAVSSKSAGVTRNVQSIQKPAPTATPRSKVKTSDKKHDAVQRYIRE